MSDYLPEGVDLPPATTIDTHKYPLVQSSDYEAILVSVRLRDPGGGAALTESPL